VVLRPLKRRLVGLGRASQNKENHCRRKDTAQTDVGEGFVTRTKKDKSEVGFQRSRGTTKRNALGGLKHGMVDINGAEILPGEHCRPKGNTVDVQRKRTSIWG